MAILEPAIVAVSPLGIATGVTEGDADVSASYSGVSGSLHLRVAPRTYALAGPITDDASGGSIAAARVEVLNGVNAGKVVLNDGAGEYLFEGLLPDVFRLRVSADNYLTGQQGVTVPTNPRADFALHRVPAPCKVTVNPTFIGVSSGGVVTPAHFEITTGPSCSWTVTSDRLLLKLKLEDTPSYSVTGSGSASVLLNFGVSFCGWTDTMKVTWAGGQIGVTAQQFFPIC